MATKSNRSAGSQFTSRGVTQGSTLVGPNSGLPIDELVGPDGRRRLAVDAAITVPTLDVELSPDRDGVYIGNQNNSYKLEIQPDGSIDVNVTLTAAADSVAIGDGHGNILAINPDGSVNVNLVQSNPGELKSFYNEVTSLASGILTTIQTYTAPVGRKSYFQKVEYSGTNIAEYTVYINASVEGKKRTYFGAELNGEIKFVETGTGLPLQVGDVVTVKVIHSRPDLGDFNSRIQVIEV